MPNDKWRESLAQLESAVQGIQDSDSFRRYLDTQARFHKYSFGNCMLIAFQRPEATRVAGYKTWQSLGRQVCKGAKGIAILVPYMMRVNATEESEESRIAESAESKPVDARVVTRFGTGYVFDVADTTGADLPSLNVPTLSGDDNGLWARLVTLAQSFSLSVETADSLTGQAMGYIQGARIVVRQSSPAQMSKTLAHEIAHHLDSAKSSNSDSESVAE
ncbi:MAG: ArdC family protein, partial [Armatimonadota bacterium]|nr:ArdC family protein [Armatimonadota bacterium]